VLFSGSLALVIDEEKPPDCACTSRLEPGMSQTNNRVEVVAAQLSQRSQFKALAPCEVPQPIKAAQTKCRE